MTAPSGSVVPVGTGTTEASGNGTRRRRHSATGGHRSRCQRSVVVSWHQRSRFVPWRSPGRLYLRQCDSLDHVHCFVVRWSKIRAYSWWDDVRSPAGRQEEFVAIRLCGIPLLWASKRVSEPVSKPASEQVS